MPSGRGEEGKAMFFSDETYESVLAAVRGLEAQRRSGNLSAIARVTGLPRSTVANVTAILRARGQIVDRGKGNAYNYRVTP